MTGENEETVFSCVKCEHDLNGHRYVRRDEGCYCVNCYNEFLANSCFGCEQKIHPKYKSYCNEDRYWHESCFVCTKCDTALSADRFALKEKAIYCTMCFDDNFSPSCNKCNEVIRIGSKKLSWRDNVYHSDCMFCFSCKKTLSSDPFHPKSDGNNYCLDCFKEQFAYKCTKCHDAIIDDGVLHEDQPFHANCFKCADCQASLRDKQFALIDSKEVCTDCYATYYAEKCASCNRAITSLDGDKHMEFEGRKWHEVCMACKFCQLSLVEKYFLAEGKESQSIDIMCLDCGLKQKGLDPEKYRQGFYDDAENSDEEEEGAKPDPKLADPFKLDLLEVHNNYRAKHGVPDLKWSNSCAVHAQEWAEKLIRDNEFKHSDNPRYGENVAKALKLNPTADEVVYHWYKEVKDYDFSKLEFQPGTGHFAQVIWKSTKYAGFGYAKNGEITIIVANYKCPGNMMGQFENNISQPHSDKEN
ncbi:four and a half LIM domains protein 2-like [Symsagittifera roscoffensis]|uniref:four and a half LIM domains protein 2-like n=1 Tax=Symsagittifera roscoffensis TaxID=84072 RepID=UPI00307C1129